MRKSNKFDKLFLVGLAPISFILVFIMAMVITFFYSKFSKKGEVEVKEKPKTEHVCIKPEKIYIHDTIIVNVPISCKKPHVQDEIKTADPQTINDSNGSEIQKP